MLSFVHIGIGQCGNRLAEQFGKNGRLALAINTARVDMSSIDSKAIATKNQIHIALAGNKDGAGRNPEIGKESMEANLDKVYEAIMKATKDLAVDRFVLWAGLGGGTGTGGVLPLMQHLIDNGHKVMLGLTIPRRNEQVKLQHGLSQRKVTRKWMVFPLPRFSGTSSKSIHRTMECQNTR